MLSTRLALALIAGISAQPAAAQTAIVLWPTDPRIEADKQATALWLQNRSTKPVTLQVRALGWDQSSGEDQYPATGGVVASPPIAQVGPGERQLVRIIRREPQRPGEQAYRLLIDELPQVEPAGGGAVVARLNVQMRYSLPLFVYGGDRAALQSDLTARIGQAGGKRWVEIVNRGSGHARLTDLRSTSRGESRPIRAGLVGYVLPGATMRWPLPDDVDAGRALTVSVNGKDVELLQPVTA